MYLDTIIAKLTHMTHGRRGCDHNTGRAFVIREKGDEFVALMDAADALQYARAEIDRLRAENERLLAIIKAAEVAIARDEDMNGAMRWLLSAADEQKAPGPLDYVPIVGKGVDEHERRKECGALTCQEPPFGVELAPYIKIVSELLQGAVDQERERCAAILADAVTALGQSTAADNPIHNNDKAAISE